MGAYAGYRGTATDVTERRRARAALEDSERRLAVSQRIAGVGTFERDLETDKVTWTDEAFRLLGHEPGSVESTLNAFLERVHPDDRAIVQGDRDAVARGDAPGDSRFRVVWPDESIHMMDTIASLGLDDDGRPVRVTRTMRDVTEADRAEQDLRRSEETLRLFMDSASQGFSIFDGELRYLAANAYTADWLGTTPDQLIGKKLSDLAEQSDESLAAFGNVMASGQPLSREYVVVRPTDGAERTIEGTVFAVGEGLGMTFADVTDRVGAVEALRRSEEIRRLFMESASDIIVILDAKLCLLAANRVALELYGLREAEAVRRPLAEVSPGLAGTEHYRRYERVRQTGVPYTAEVEVEWPDKRATLAVSAFPVGDGVGIIARDITEQQAAEAELRATRSMFESAFDSNPSLASIVRVDDSRFLKVNDAWCRTLGFEREEVIGATADELGIWVNPSERGAVLAQARTMGGLDGVPMQIRTSDGRVIAVELFVETLYYGGGAARFSVVHDLTARKRHEDALRAAKEAAEAASQTKSRFLANVSHELRTPLNAIIGFSEVLAAGIAGPLNDKQREYAGDIQDSGEHLLSLIGDLLDLSAIELGQIVLERDRVDLGACVAACVRLVAARADQEGIEIRVDDSVSVPPIEGDERKIRQALLNIIANAVKFSGRGALVTIEGSTTDTACAITIRDTGPGMDAAALDMAFTEFGRSTHAAARRVEGSGLGLPLAKSFVEAHGGELTIDSQPGAGTIITLAFPQRT